MKRIGCLMLAMAAVGLLHAAEPTLKLDLGGGVSLDLVLVRAGSFFQGSPDTEADRDANETRRQVTLSRDYYIGRSSVTRGQWERFVAETGYRTEAETGTSGGYGWDGSTLSQRKEFTWRNPGFPQDASHPVCLVTFPDAEAFCRWLGKNSGRTTTLPTEAQWEYACRAGNDTAWHAGNDPSAANQVSWHKGNAGNGTRPATSAQPNPWGLHIGGNVSEWCLDWFAPYPPGQVTNPLQQNPNLSDKPRRVVRGGSWNRDAKNTRSAARFRLDPRSRNADVGFRVVCATDVTAPAVDAVNPANLDQPLLPPHARQTPAAPAQPAHSNSHEFSYHSAPPPRAFSFSFFSGLLCLLAPLVLIAFAVFLVVKRKQAAATSTGFPTRLPVSQPVPKASFRVVDDGFWVEGAWPPGTPLHLKYLVGGMPMEQNIVYQPGEKGQYIFTGQRPRSPEALAESPLPPDGPSAVVPPPFPVDSPLVHDAPPPLPAWRSDDDNFSRPSHRPSAY